MSATPGLRATQELFWRLLVAPEGARAGLVELSPEERSVAAGLVRERPGMASVDRIDVYANMYFFRILDVLKDDFPVLLALVGDDAFHNLVTDYLLVHPSRHWSLRWVGERLPAFLHDHEVARAAPHLADVAALEWALHDAFDAADGPLLQAEALAMLAPEDWPELTLALDPSVRLLDLATPATRIWQRVKAGDEVDARESGRCCVRVWRKEMRVFHKTIAPSEHAALRAVGQGVAFAEVCERSAAAEPGDAATRVVGWVRDWLADGLLAAQPRGAASSTHSRP